MQKAPPSNSIIAWMASQHSMPLAFEDAAMAFGVDLDRVAAEQPAHDVHRVREEEPLGTGVAAPVEHLGRHVDRVAQPRVGHHRRAELARAPRSPSRP